MIDLITGLPGNGKTLYALQLVEERARKEGRPVFYARIKDLKLPWTKIDPFEWAQCPPSSIVVIDECQQSADPDDPKSPSLFGVRQRGAPVPPWAAALETHRHKGIDLVLITQDPMLLDPHDRKLVRTHFHVVRTFGLQRATIHEFQGTKPDVSRSRQGSIRHEWRYPKDVFKWYTSAEVHTGKARVPMRIWVLLSLPLIIGALAWIAWARFLDPKAHVPQATSDKPATGILASVRGVLGKTTADYLAEQAPRVPGLAFTAPVYDDLVKPSVAPYPAACVLANTWCKCWTQQATRLETPEALCKEIARKGFYVAWSQPAQAQQIKPGGDGGGAPSKQSDPLTRQASGSDAGAIRMATRVEALAPPVAPTRALESDSSPPAPAPPQRRGYY